MELQRKQFEGDYYEHKALNNTLMGVYMEDPKRFWNEFLGTPPKEKENQYLRRGKMVHHFLLQNESFFDHYEVVKTINTDPDSGKLGVSNYEMKILMELQEKYLNHPGVAAILEKPHLCEFESRFDYFGLPCKALMDYVSTDGKVIMDIKTSSKSPVAFQSACETNENGYLRQLAWYSLSLPLGDTENKRIRELQEKSGGNPDKLSQEEKDFLNEGLKNAKKGTSYFIVYVSWENKLVYVFRVPRRRIAWEVQDIMILIENIRIGYLDVKFRESRTYRDINCDFEMCANRLYTKFADKNENF